MPEDGDAAPALLAALDRLWAELPTLAAGADNDERFTFAVSMQTGEAEGVDLYVARGLHAGALLRTVAHKLERQRVAVARRSAARLPVEVTELHGGHALRVLDQLRAIRSPLSPMGFVPMVRGGRA